MTGAHNRPNPPSALVDFASALLPPESGGPDPTRLAALTDRLLAELPPSPRLGARAAFAAVAATAWLRHGRPLRRLDPERRAAPLGRLAAAGPLGAALVDGPKWIVMLAWGAEAYAGEVSAVANRRPPARADAELCIAPATEPPERVRCDAVVVGSGAGGGVRGARARPRRARDDRRRGGRAARGRVAQVAWGARAVRRPLSRRRGDGRAGRDDVERALRVAPAPREAIGENVELALAGAERLGWRAAPLERNAPGCRGACQC